MIDRSSVAKLTLRELFDLGHALSDADPNGNSLSLDELVSVDLKNAAIEPGVLRDGVRSQLDALLDIEIGSVIAAAWSKAEQLQEYRDPARHPPGELSTVSLTEHTIESHYRPSIELLVNGKSIQTLGVDLAIELTIEALRLEIRDGRIVAVRPGSCRVKGEMSLATQRLAQLAPRALELPGRCSLGEGVAIPDLTTSGATSASPSASGAE